MLESEGECEIAKEGERGLESVRKGLERRSGEGR